MKCDQCGHHNPGGKNFCQNCGSPLTSNSYKSPVRKYKDSAKQYTNKKMFNKKEKLIIALCLAGVVLLILSSVVPSDLDLSQVMDNINNTDNQTPTQIENNTIEKINTKINSKSTTLNAEGQIVLNAYVSDENDIAVNGGTTSVYVNDVKYSGQVVNGNVNIVLPDMIRDKQVTLNYEGNDEYNPSQTTAYIEIAKTDTKIDIQNNNDTVTATLTTSDGQAIPNATISISSNNNNLTQTTDDQGKVTVSPQDSTTQITFRYDGNTKYNKAENTIQLKPNKTDTQLSAQYDEEEKEVTIKLSDSSGNPISGSIMLYDNDDTIKEETNTDGLATFNIKQGEHKLFIKYEGNEKYNPSNTTLNLNISKETTNDTNTTNATNRANTTNTTNTTNSTKSSTVITAEINDAHTSVTAKLTDNNDKALSNKYITVTLSNGTELTKETDENGIITIYLDYSSNIDRIELSYNGNDDYYSTTKILDIEDRSGSSHH